MDNDINSSFESVGSSGSSVCPVCQGIGDLKNPRGASVKLPDDHHSGKRYAYVYMHHPSLRVLCDSADAGCDMCALLRDVPRRRIGKGFHKATMACSPSPGTTGTHFESTKHAVESEDDASSIATNLAELTRPENLQKDWEFKHFRSRRIALRHFSDEGTGPRGSLKPFYIQVLALGHDFPSKIRGFKQPCGSIFHDDIMTLLEMLT